MAKIKESGSKITRRVVTEYDPENADDMRAFADALKSKPVTLMQKLERDVQSARTTLAQKGLLDGALLHPIIRDKLESLGFQLDRMTAHKGHIIKDFGEDSVEGALAEFVWTWEVLETASETLSTAISTKDAKPNSVKRHLAAVEELSATARHPRPFPRL